MAGFFCALAPEVGTRSKRLRKAELVALATAGTALQHERLALPCRAMPRIRSQLAVQVEPALLQRLRAHSSATGRTMSALVGEAVEALLAGGHGTPRQGMADADLLARIEALEEQVARVAPPARVITAPELQVESTETIGVPALAALLGISTKAISKWAKERGPGAIRDGYRLLGKVPANGPGPARWAFERVVA